MPKRSEDKPVATPSDYVLRDSLDCLYLALIDLASGKKHCGCLLPPLS